MLVGENIGEFRYLNYLGEKLWEMPGKLIKMDIKYSVNLREKALTIGHQFSKFANFFFHQSFHYAVHVLKYWS